MPTSIAPSSYWQFNEASGDLIDAIGSNTATETSGAIASTAGLVAGARDFELADTHYFSKADPLDLRGGNSRSFTLAGWINIESRTGDNSFIGKWGATANEYLFFLGGGDSCIWAVGQAIGGAPTVTLDVTGNGVWHFLVGWHDIDANLSGFSVNNGAPSTVAVDGNGLQATTQRFDIGAADATSFFDGRMDEWGFYPGVLTADDRTFLFNGGAGRSLSEIVASALAVPSGWIGQWPTVVRTRRR